MILLLGSNAYSPFRMDALKDAIAKLDPSLGPVNIDAKWVYAIQTNGESFDPEELKRARLFSMPRANARARTSS